MSVLISDLITQVLDETGNTAARRTTRDDCLRYFNRVQRVIAVATECLETDAYFDLIAEEPRYAYPEEGVRISGVRISRVAVPASLDDYEWLSEEFRERFRDATDLRRDRGYISQYIARNNWIEFLQMPDADVTDGGILTYWRIPERVVSETQALTMELPDFMEDHTIEGMKILVRMTGRERAVAEGDWQKWMLAADALKTKIQDRSADRRASIRPPNYMNPHAGSR